MATWTPPCCRPASLTARAVKGLADAEWIEGSGSLLLQPGRAWSGGQLSLYNRQCCTQDRGSAGLDELHTVTLQ